MLERWLDRDDITEDDLHEMTAEEEVLDWMVGSPLPAARRPDYLPESAWEAPGGGARRPLPPPAPPPPAWPLLVVGGVVATTGVGLFMVSMALLAAWVVVGP